MPLPTIADVNMSEGAHKILVYVNDTSFGLASNLFLFSYWAIICFGTYFAAKRFRGSGDFIASFSVASLLTAIVGIQMAIVPGLLATTATVIVLFIVGFALLLFTRPANL